MGDASIDSTISGHPAEQSGGGRQYMDASRDLIEGVLSSHIWGSLGLHDIRQRYRRSVIGPFWFTISTAILVIVLGILYSQLLQQDIASYLPYLGVGLVIWQFIATSATESTEVFNQYQFMIKQVRLPLSVHVCRQVWRNFVILMHSVPVLLIALIVFDRFPGWHLLVVPFGLVALVVNALWIGIVLGVICTRYRDIPPIVNNLVTVAFFFTPVMWSPDLLSDRAWIAQYNPFYHLIEVVRAPLLSKPIPFQSWLWVVGMSVAGLGAAQWLLKRYRSRVPYWL